SHLDNPVLLFRPSLKGRGSASPARASSRWSAVGDPHARLRAYAPVRLLDAPKLGQPEGHALQRDVHSFDADVCGGDVLQPGTNAVNHSSQLAEGSACQ